MSEKYTKWVAAWGNAISIREQTELRYTKDVTFRYPVRMPFDGSRLRFHVSNLTGTEPVTLELNCARHIKGKIIAADTIKKITFAGKDTVTLGPGERTVSDAIDFAVSAGEMIAVNLYLGDYTQMNAGVLITGPLSRGFYSYGNQLENEELPLDLSRNTNWYYFMDTIDVLTEEKNHALICFGDSITAQSWPDYLTLRAWEEGYHDVSIIRRAVSGTRILRQYDCITYAAYGLKGETRFPIEIETAGAEAVLIQHGINDIIHPVGTDINPFRPWSDLPKCREMAEGYTKFYIDHARRLGLKVWGGTLIPIKGWRTYAPFREDLKNAFNEWLRTTSQLDGCVDFDKAVRDPADPAAFLPAYNSGDNLHPSEAGYKAMADAVSTELLK